MQRSEMRLQSRCPLRILVMRFENPCHRHNGHCKLKSNDKTSISYELGIIWEAAQIFQDKEAACIKRAAVRLVVGEMQWG